MILSARTIGLGLVAACGVLSGCSRDARLADRKIRSVTVKPVTHYGTALDEQATPKQVAFVAMRAMRDDFLATTAEARELALDAQFDICAANVIDKKKTTSVSRDEFIHDVVYHWTPTVSHYVGGFETEWANAESRLVQSALYTEGAEGAAVEKCDVRMELADPDGHPGAGVVMITWLAKDSGLWRVTHVGFDRTRRTIARSG